MATRSKSMLSSRVGYFLLYFGEKLALTRHFISISCKEEEGLTAMREALGRSGNGSILTEDLVDLARMVLTSNNLTFNGNNNNNLRLYSADL